EIAVGLRLRVGRDIESRLADRQIRVGVRDVVVSGYIRKRASADGVGAGVLAGSAREAAAEGERAVVDAERGVHVLAAPLLRARELEMAVGLGLRVGRDVESRLVDRQIGVGVRDVIISGYIRERALADGVGADVLAGSARKAAAEGEMAVV